MYCLIYSFTLCIFFLLFNFVLHLIIFRATSTSNVMMLSSTTPMGPLTRRSSERELNECSGKKRAASAGGLSNRNVDGKFASLNFFLSIEFSTILRMQNLSYKLHFGKRIVFFFFSEHQIFQSTIKDTPYWASCIGVICVTPLSQSTL